MVISDRSAKQGHGIDAVCHSFHVFVNRSESRGGQEGISVLLNLFFDLVRGQFGFQIFLVGFGWNGYFLFEFSDYCCNYFTVE